MLRLCVFVALFASTLALCPSGFELTRNGECYRQLGDTFNYYAATAPEAVKAACIEVNALPVIINTEEDNTYWLSVARADRSIGGGSANYGNVLLGIECNANGYYQWSDGSHVNYRPDKYDSELVNRCDVAGQYCMWYIDPSVGDWVKYCNTYKSVDVYCEITPAHRDYEPDSDCGNFAYDQDNDVCWQVGVTTANYTEANTVCHSFGSTLASIHSDRENSFVRRMAVSKGLVNGMLLGGVIHSDKKKKVEWGDGTKDDYEHFVPGFPIDGYGDCLAMETNIASGQWLNVDCSIDLPYACRRNTNREEPVCVGGLQQENDIIYSPGFPSDSSLPCDYLFKVDPWFVVEVEVLFLEANSCCDHLVLFEGLIGSDLIADLSGDGNNGRKFRSATNTMRASWQPHGAKNVMGIMITFRGVPKS